MRDERSEFSTSQSRCEGAQFSEIGLCGASEPAMIPQPAVPAAGDVIFLGGSMKRWIAAIVAASSTFVLSIDARADFTVQTAVVDAVSGVSGSSYQSYEHHEQYAEDNVIGPLSLSAMSAFDGGGSMASLSGSANGNAIMLVSGAAYTLPGFGWGGHHEASAYVTCNPGSIPMSVKVSATAIHSGDGWVNAAGQHVVNDAYVAIGVSGDPSVEIQCYSIGFEGDEYESPEAAYASFGIAFAVFYNGITLPLNAGDVDGDGQIGVNDVQAIQGIVNGFSSNKADLYFDLNGDLSVTTADVDYFLANYANTVRGDADLDGDVDLADAGIVATNMGLPGMWAQGDFNGDLVVDSADMAYVTTNYGYGVP